VKRRQLLLFLNKENKQANCVILLRQRTKRSVHTLLERRGEEEMDKEMSSKIRKVECMATMFLLKTTEGGTV
jgi:hypothetical protein